LTYEHARRERRRRIRRIRNVRSGHRLRFLRSFGGFWSG